MRMKFLLLLLLSFTAYATPFEGYLTLYVSPAPYGINWSSPPKLLTSIQLNRLSQHPRPLGVVYSELACGQDRNLVTSSYQQLDLFNRLVREGQGLGILFSTFSGKLEDDEKLKAELKTRLQENDVRFIRFAINQGHCQRLQKFLAEYTSLSVGRNWGLPHDPLKAEGGTSIALAVSFLEILGFRDEMYAEGWINTLLVPTELEKASFIKLIASSWATSKEPHRVLSFWDKEKMYQWIGLNLKNFPATTIEGVNGILIDRRHFPVLQTPMWRQHLTR